MDDAEACNRVHEILENLPKLHEPSNSLPLRGIYFFYEEGERCSHTAKERVVRVGTHRADTLKRRLRNHYNGNREGSVFRKHLGTALLNRSGASEEQIKDWRKKRKGYELWKQFERIEQKVDEIIRSKFFFRIISIDSIEERKEFEEKLIATISTCHICEPSNDWLGRFASSEKVRRSGLWNSNFVDSITRFTEEDLKRLEQLTY